MRFNLKRRVVFFKVPPYRRRLISSLNAVVFLLLFALFSFYLLDFRIRPTLSRLAESKARQSAITAINRAVMNDIAPKIDYQKLIAIQYSKNGKVSMIQPNTGEISRITTEITLAIQQSLYDLPKELVQIPVGLIMGSRILADFGPEIAVEVTPVGTVETSIADQFEVAGINQLRHRIYVKIKAIIKMVVPLVDEEFEVNTDIPLAEAVVMGDVPEVYVNGASGVILPAMNGKSDQSANNK